MEAIKSLSTHLENRPAELRELQGKGIKVVGCFAGDYVPEEIVYASGAIPVCLVHGDNPTAIDATLSTTPRFLCPFAKAQFGERLLKQPYYNLIDMLVAPITCQHLRRIADMWDFYTDVNIFRLGVPHEYDSQHGLEYYVKQLKALRETLERFTGNKITDEGLRRAIEIYNRMRELLKKISLMRKAEQTSVSSLEFIKLNHASCYADPIFMVEVLESLYHELTQESAAASNHVDGTRLLLTGPNIAYGDYKILELVEQYGGKIVIEELCEGVRYYWGNVGTEGDLIQALARKYLRDRIPCAFMRSSAKKRFNFITSLAKDFNVSGVIWYQLLYCDTYDIESYYFTQKMKEIDMPFLMLESDYDISDRERLKTSIESFLETIR